MVRVPRFQRRTTRVVVFAGVVPLVVAATAFSALALTSPGIVLPSPDAPATSWRVPLTPVAGDVNTAFSDGRLRLGPAGTASRDGRQFGEHLSPVQPLDKPVSQFTSTVDARVPAGAEVGVELRGEAVTGRWTEWYDAKSAVTMPAPVRQLQARVTLWTAGGPASPTVRSITVKWSNTAGTALTGPQVQAQAAAAPLSYRVFATREGLVGATTANGHVIKSRDHFVALPSRRALSPNGSTQYSVRVCNPANGRCETAPVWDVGPWNTRDDYWNPSSVRENWSSLPQGRPEAQAAYQDGFNGGKDQYGRTVANPAGIDLADGTFWDGLGLTTNSWVTVTYLWTTPTAPLPTVWPTIRSGSAGEDVRTVQYLLNARGMALTVDGAYGPATTAAVKTFQSANGLTADGIVGPTTWAKLIIQVREGSGGNPVKAVQSQLVSHGYALTVDGVFGPKTASAVAGFQNSRGLVADSIVGPNTWLALVGS